MSKADEILYNIHLIEISRANIDIGDGKSQTPIYRKLEMAETEKRIKELQQYVYKQ